MNDAQLMQRMAAGDEDAFRSLYREHHAGVFAFALRCLGSAAAAEDVTQETFLVLLEKPAGFDAARGPLRLYLFGIARRRIWKRMHSDGRESRLASQPQQILWKDSPPNPQQALLESECASRVRAAVLGLPASQREALVLFHYHGLSLAEIGRITGRQANAVKQNLHRARAALRNGLRQDLSGGARLAAGSDRLQRSR